METRHKPGQEWAPTINELNDGLLLHPQLPQETGSDALIGRVIIDERNNERGESVNIRSASTRVGAWSSSWHDQIPTRPRLKHGLWRTIFSGIVMRGNIRFSGGYVKGNGAGRRDFQRGRGLFIEHKWPHGRADNRVFHSS